MDEGLPVVGPEVDLSKITAINQKRTLAFLNHFISHTVRFLNQFSCVCEKKLSDLSSRIQKVEITMSLLEAKLASIPGLENITASSVPEAQAAPTSQETQSSQPEPQEKQAEQEAEPSPVAPTMTVSKDPRYAKYFQMLKVGVPTAALRPKMIADGLNPDYLDTPDAPAPDGGAATHAQGDSDDDDSSISSFSDDD